MNGQWKYIKSNLRKLRSILADMRRTSPPITAIPAAYKASAHDKKPVYGMKMDLPLWRPYVDQCRVWIPQGTRWIKRWEMLDAIEWDAGAVSDDATPTPI